MARPPRAAVGGVVYHVLNRANARATLFATPADYLAFVEVVAEAQAEQPMPILSFCVMPNHWHFVVLPRCDGDLSRFFRWLTQTHTQRWHAHRGTIGCGHVYQGRFKSFAVETDDHFLTVCRYVERNAVRAGLAVHAEDWLWGSVWQRYHGAMEGRPILSAWPVPCPSDWLNWVNTPQTAAEEAAVRRCAKRCRPFGSPAWTEQIILKLGLQTTLHPRGRQRKNRVDFHPSLFDKGT